MLNLNDSNREECRKLGRVIDTVKFLQGGIEADIFLKKDTLVFSGLINEFSFSSKDGDEVKKWAMRQLVAASTLDWVPVICVLDTENGDYNYSGKKLRLHQISIDVHRFFVAPLPDGSVRSVEWDVDPEKRLKSYGVPYCWDRELSKLENGRILLPIHSDQSHILPYTEELWTGLNELMKGIDSLRNNLHALLKSDSGLKRLELMRFEMTKLLSEPK